MDEFNKLGFEFDVLASFATGKRSSARVNFGTASPIILIDATREVTRSEHRLPPL